MSEKAIPISASPKAEAVEQARAASHSCESGHPSVLRFAGHVVEMMVSMMVGMMAFRFIGQAMSGGLTKSEAISLHPVLFILGMAVSMTVPMVAWMCIRGHGVRSCIEMAATMVVPAMPLVALAWLGVTGAPRAYMGISTLTMIVYMVVRRREYGM